MAILKTDNFTRANSSDFGATWDPNTGESSPLGFVIAGNLGVPSVLGSDCSERDNSVTWPNAQYCEITFGVTTADGVGSGPGPIVRAAASPTKTYYRCVGNASGYELGKKVAGTFTSLSSGAGTTFAVGDKLWLGFPADDGVWVLKKNGTQFATGTDNDIASGAIGVGFSSSSVEATISLLEAGDFGGGGPAPILMGASWQ